MTALPFYACLSTAEQGYRPQNLRPPAAAAPPGGEQHALLGGCDSQWPRQFTAFLPSPQPQIRLKIGPASPRLSRFALRPCSPLAGRCYQRNDALDNDICCLRRRRARSPTRPDRIHPQGYRIRGRNRCSGASAHRGGSPRIPADVPAAINRWSQHSAAAMAMPIAVCKKWPPGTATASVTVAIVGRFAASGRTCQTVAAKMTAVSAWPSVSSLPPLAPAWPSVSLLPPSADCGGVSGMAPAT